MQLKRCCLRFISMHLSSIHLYRHIFCITILCCLGIHLGAQIPTGKSLASKKVGLYISSKAVSFTDAYHIGINQFLSIGEDRSWNENQKTEFLIRLGNRLAAEIQAVSQADTVIFLNANPVLGRSFQQMGSAELFETSVLDAVVSIDRLELEEREERLTYIRSNQLRVRKVYHKVAHLDMQTHLPTQNRLDRVCWDQGKKTKEATGLDMFQKDSPLGEFLSSVFSTWWNALTYQKPSECGK